MTYEVESLSAEHVLDTFDCGEPDLNEWLKRHAHNAAGQGTRTYVLVESGDRSVVGYFAVAPHLVQKDAAPSKIARGGPQQIPAILLAKLALDRRLHGRGLGGELLVRALERIVAVARSAGGKVIVVDAIDAAAARFYERHDFERLPNEPSRLALKVSTAAKALGIPWP